MNNLEKLEEIRKTLSVLSDELLDFDREELTENQQISIDKIFVSLTDMYKNYHDLYLYTKRNK